MIITLADRQKEKEVVVDMKVDYSYPPKDLMLVLANFGEVCELDSEKCTSPFDEYFFKKVQNIVVGSFKYGEHRFTLTLAQYFDGIDPYFIILKEEGESKYGMFEDIQPIDTRYQSFKLIDYSEYKDVCEITGSEIMSRKDMISESFKGNLNVNEYKLYNTIDRQKDFNLFLNSKQFSTFLDNEEIRTNG